MLTNFTIKDVMKRLTGFTLIELIVLLAIVGIVTVLAIPGLQNYTRLNRTASQTNELVTAMQLARSEAVKRNVPVFVCASSSAITPAPQCDSVNWQDGWLVFADPNSNALDGAGAFTGTVPAANDAILAKSGGLRGGTNIRSLNFAHNNYVRFNSSGRADSTGSFVFCDSDRDVKQARAINISLTGLLSLAQDTDTTKNYIVNLPDGTDVTCP